MNDLQTDINQLLDKLTEFRQKQNYKPLTSQQNTE